MVLGPDLNLFDKLYPEDNFYHMTDCSALNVTAVRVYPHYDKQLKNDPTLEQKLINWEINTQQQITRLKDDQGILINDRNITLLNS
ncbi:hypothetical protein Q757_00360 [Oenococcus alcoholitolerans]|uniref:Uncharacterized protein n=1 Tax=Oenococcus alcoholitolerans TaxID=931074 RepID=A0ABR4XSS6_9LACO|nr:hypothetical protein Q757_00360 [Oenococcus alcoholitolerans]